MTEYIDLLLRWCKIHVMIFAPLLFFFLLAGFIVSIELTALTPFCGTCHSMKEVYGQWEKSSHANPRIGSSVGCSDCHVREGTIGLVKDHIVNGTLQLFAEFTHSHVPAKPIVTTAMHDERCIDCHRSVIGKNYELSPQRLPERLEEIGLVVSHRFHYELRDFESDEASDLKVLEKVRSVGDLSFDERAELSFLQKVEKGNCAQCHERKGPYGELRKDRSVHLDQPMTCISCHADVVHRDEYVHGRAIPDRRSCATCHDGSYHGYLGRIFPAGCVDGAPKMEDLSPSQIGDCIQCHPKLRQVLIRRRSTSKFGKQR